MLTGESGHTWFQITSSIFHNHLDCFGEPLFIIFIYVLLYVFIHRDFSGTTYRKNILTLHWSIKTHRGTLLIFYLIEIYANDKINDFYDYHYAINNPNSFNILKKLNRVFDTPSISSIHFLCGGLFFVSYVNTRNTDHQISTKTKGKSYDYRLCENIRCG